MKEESASKRQKVVLSSTGDEAPPKIPSKMKQERVILNDYAGYSLQDSKETSSLKNLDVLRSSMTAETFFEQYISKRKPCVINSVLTTTKTLNKNNNTPEHHHNNNIVVSKQILHDIAGQHEIQVERRHARDEAFGQNRSKSRQVVLTVSDFLNSICSNNDNDGELLYWSTQEDTDDPFNVPCRQLVDCKLLPEHYPMAGNLVLSSCNMWIGRAKNGATSGLHHDYHDNFYVLQRGRKSFRLYSPDCAPRLSTYGVIERIHTNGRISYVGNETGADGRPRVDDDDEEEEGVATTRGDVIDDSEDDEEEDEIVLGKGYNYQDSEDEGTYVMDGVDDYEEMILKDETEAQQTESSDRPDSFSRIDPTRTDRQQLMEEFPLFQSCQEVIVSLEAGQVLYLPAGWFHEVTSYSGGTTTQEDDDLDDPLAKCHVAINYWYHPPDGLDCYDKPYLNDFWARYERRRMSAGAPNKPKQRRVD